MDDQRVADYFVVAGLGENPEPLEEVSNEAAIKPSFKQDPITDIVVINRSAGEKIPTNFHCLELTPTGFPANLNHGAIRCPDLFICFKRGRDKPPLKDIGILYEGKERVMEGCEVVHTTPNGRPANINNSSSSRIYITFRRADRNAATDTLVVVDLCVILANKGEEPPLTYNQILKNLNKGMVGSDVFLCYKKAMVKSDVLVYKPTILGRYPEEDYDNFPLPESVPMFCLPMGATIECWDAKAVHPMPGFSTFILTLAAGEKVYGAAVSFYEEHHESQLSDNQMRVLGLKNRVIREQYNILKTVHVRKAICLLSHWPFFDAFKKFLSQLYKISITGPHQVPIERHISHFMYDVPYPSPQRPRILVQLAHDSLSLCMPEDSPLPQSGASFITLLRNLGPELCMNLMLYILLENKILLHSLRPTVLTEVAEAVTSIIFPFHWQCPYIPLCPIGLSDVLNAPCPFIVGIDSRYFDLFDPPPDIICVDLDTNRIWLPEDKKQLNFKTMPKKAVRVLQESLHRLFEMSTPVNAGPANEEVSLEMTSVDLDFRRKKKQMQMELLIQEAFLRFMAILLRDYKSYLNPIMNQPNNRATDASVLFDMQGFLKSRDKTNTKFYTQMMRTQMFFRFIEERSFVSDKDASLAFFDECTEKIDETNLDVKLIEIDESQASERTVFIMPPEPVGLPEGSVYHYNGFPLLKPELFLKKKPSMLSVPNQPLCPNSPLSRRSKQEIKSAQKIAQQYTGNPKHWAKCLLSHCYSLWFISFPAYVQSHPKKLDALKVGLAVLQKMHAAKLPFIDQVCYRVLMQLAGQYNKPGLAVQVFSLMKRNGIQPNAITYGNYNRVMLEATWSSPMSKGKRRWSKIRNVIIGVAKFRRAIRRRSVSLYSNSGSEFDQISHASVDSYLDDHVDKTSVDTGVVSQCKVVFSPDTTKGGEVIAGGGGGGIVKGEGGTTNMVSTSVTALDDRMRGVSDGGYNSMTQEDVRRLSQLMSTGEGDSLTSSSPSPTASDPDAVDPSQVKPNKAESWNPLRFSFTKKRHHSEKQRIENEQHDGYRPRVASIVRKSISAVSDHDSQQIIQGTLLGNSAGLLFVSQSFLEHGAYLTSGDLRLEMEQACRRRNKAENGHHGPKPSRSMSLFASWRPKHLMNGDSRLAPAQAVPLRFSDLAKKEEDDVSLSSLGEEAVTSSQPKIAVTIQDSELSSGDKSEVKDSGVGLDEPPHSDIAGEVTDADKVDTPSQSVLDVLTDQAGQSNPESQSSQPEQEASSDRPQSGLNVCNTDSGADESASHTSGATVSSVLLSDNVGNVQSTDQISNEVVGAEGNLDCVQSEVDKDGAKGEEEKDQKAEGKKISKTPSPRPPHPTSLGEVGRTMSSPLTHPLGSPTPTQTAAPAVTTDTRNPVRKQQSLPTPQNPTPSTEPRKSIQMPESVLSRSQSLKRGGGEVMAKTNEALTGFWKLATKAANASYKVASASYSRFAELKESITTPIKNAASLSSLTHSQDDLDGAGSDRSSIGGSGGGYGEEDRTSIGSKDRWKQPQNGGSHERLSIKEEAAANQAQFGDNSLGSAPSPSFLDSFWPPREVRSDSVSGQSVDAALMTVAMEVEMSSCSRCSRCHRLVFDEEIMSGWSADDSDLNTKCPFCHAKFVPNLQVYVKDWRGQKKSMLLSTDSNPEGIVPPPNSTPTPLANAPVSPSQVTEEKAVEEKQESTEIVSPMHMDSYPLSLQEAAAAVRRRCTSESMMDTGNSSHKGYYNHYPMGLSVPRSPLSLSIDEDVNMPTSPSTVPELRKDFMTRSACTADPLVFPYLSPLVLRKELEYVLDNEGELCLGTQAFLDGHPIIFWNMVWYFRRLEVPSHLSSLLLTAASFNTSQSSSKTAGQFDSRNILIRPLWDNVRIHDEMGLPMYVAWGAGHKSTVVDALVTEQESFSRPTMYNIISSIQRNDVLTAIKLVVDNRRRLMGRKRRFRSLYREILFLSFVACGRENIDHDAFDREFGLVFEGKLSPAEIRRLQEDDKPRSASVQWCRRVFCELDV